jgi:hypothetical protein
MRNSWMADNPDQVVVPQQRRLLSNNRVSF